MIVLETQIDGKPVSIEFPEDSENKITGDGEAVELLQDLHNLSADVVSMYGKPKPLTSVAPLDLKQFLEAEGLPVKVAKGTIPSVDEEFPEGAKR